MFDESNMGYIGVCIVSHRGTTVYGIMSNMGYKVYGIMSYRGTTVYWIMSHMWQNGVWHHQNVGHIGA